MTAETPILVTGAAGFIGFHVSQRLLADGRTVVGIDNLNAYYDVSLKRSRLKELSGDPRFQFFELDIADRGALHDLFIRFPVREVIHLAAQVGVRYSVTHPHAYVQSNVVGFLNILEECRHGGVAHLVFASSSSVYGGNPRIPFSVKDGVDHPLSLYAATKRADELMAHCYAHLYQLPCTGLRFFTVYGPWGRPDMALFLFTRAILEGDPIQVFDEGKIRRDFTYIDDVVEGVVRLLPRAPAPNPSRRAETLNPSTSFAPYRVFNVGNHQPVELLDFIRVLENALGKKAVKQFRPLPPEDVPVTYADVTDLMEEVGFRPQTSLTVGIGRFVDWYRRYYAIPV